MIKKIIFSLMIVSVIGLSLLLNLTSPSNIGPMGILVFFIMLYIIFLGLFSFFLHIIGRISAGFLKRPLRFIDFKRSYYYATVLAFAPIILIAQQSIGRVGFFEFILVIVFEIIACIYISKR